MKSLCILIVSLLCSVLVQAQNKPAFEKEISLNQNTRSNRQMSESEMNYFSDLVSRSNETSLPNTFISSLTNTTTSRLDTLAKLNALWVACQSGGQVPTVIVGDKNNYSRYWALNQTFQQFPQQPGGQDTPQVTALRTCWGLSAPPKLGQRPCQ